MSGDGGSWAPFGPSEDDDDPPQRFQPPQPAQPQRLPDPEPPPAPAPPLPPVSQWQGPPPQAYGTPRQMASNATASLILGIVGLVFCPLIASAAAIALGTSARREIRADPALTGGAQATWGVALGWVGVFFGLLIVFAFLAGAT